MRLLNLDAATARVQVLAALETLAAVQVVVREEGVEDGRVQADERLPGYVPNYERRGEVRPPDGVLLRSLTLVSRSTLFYSDQDEDFIVMVVLSQEVLPFIRFAAAVRNPTLLLPNWLHFDARIRL